MAQNINISIPASTWTLITNSDVAALTFQVKGGYALSLQGAFGAVTPSVIGPTYNPTQGKEKLILADMFLSIAGVNRIYVWSEMPNSVWVCHA